MLWRIAGLIFCFLLGGLACLAYAAENRPTPPHIAGQLAPRGAAEVRDCSADGDSSSPVWRLSLNGAPSRTWFNQ